MPLNSKSELWNHFSTTNEDGVLECKLCKQRLKSHRNLKIHIKKVHKKCKQVDKHFDFNVFENLSVCKTCSQSVPNRLYAKKFHMRKMHNIQISLPEYSPAELPSSSQPHNGNQIKALVQVSKRKLKSKSAANKRRALLPLYIKMDKYTIIRSVIGLIAEDGVSPHLFNSQHFKTVLRSMCEAISGSEGNEFKMDWAEIERVISLITNYIRNDVLNDLHCRLLSIKIDTDLNTPSDTFCISAQFITDSKIQRHILGVIKLDDDQLKESHIKQILYKYNIDSNQIISAFWDNTKHKYNKQVKNSEYLKEMDLFESYPDIFLGGVKLEPYLGTIAQLCLLDILKTSNIFQKFLECRNMTKFISDESNGYYELFESNNLTIPQLDSPWKAGSTYKMMNDLHAARNFLKDVKFEELEHPEDHLNCNDELLSFVETFCTSTSYLQRSIMRYYSEELHIGDFFAQWLKCKLLTEKLVSATNNTNDLACMMSTQVLTAIENRTKYLLNQNRFVACLYLDPRFQHILNSDQKSRAVKYLKNLWCRAELYIVDDPESIEYPAQMFDDDENAFLDEFLSQDIRAKDMENSDISQKIEQLKLEFQAADTNILSFWGGFKKTDPEMHTLSAICFAIPATENYGKTHYFDIDGLDTDSELSTYTKENLLTLRINAHLLDDALAHLKLNDYGHSNIISLSDSETECHAISDDENNVISDDENNVISDDEVSDTTSTMTTYPVNPLPSTIADVQPNELPTEEFI